MTDLILYCYSSLLQENDSKRARAIKKANDEREMKKLKEGIKEKYL